MSLAIKNPAITDGAICESSQEKLFCCGGFKADVLRAVRAGCVVPQCASQVRASHGCAKQICANQIRVSSDSLDSGYHLHNQENIVEVFNRSIAMHQIAVYN